MNRAGSATRVLCVVIRRDANPETLRRQLQNEADRARAGTPGEWRWTYCGTDPALYRRLRRLAWPCEHQPLGRLVQESARRLRLPFIDFTGALDVRPPVVGEIFAGFPFWWLTPFSCRNILVSRVFVLACQVHALQRFAGRWSLLVVVDEPAVAAMIASSLPGCTVAGGGRRPLEWVRQAVRGHAKALVYLCCFLLLFRCAPVLPRRIAFTFVTFLYPGSFSGGETYRDVFFGDFVERCRREGGAVVFPLFLNPSGTVRSTMAHLRAVRRDVPDLLVLIHPFRCLARFVAVYLRALRLAVKACWALRRPRRMPVDGVDVGPVLASEARAYFGGFGYLGELVLYVRLRAVFEEFDVGRVVYPMENHAWERVLLAAGRRRAAEARPVFVGYQHSFLSDMHLFYFPSSLIREVVPTPDLVFASTRRYQRLLAAYDGYQGVPVLYAGALRFGAGFTPAARPDEVRRRLGVPPEARLWVATLPNYRPVALEMILRLAETVETSEDAYLVVKEHPEMPIRKDLGSVVLPPRLLFTDLALAEVLEVAERCYYAMTSACFRARAKGVKTQFVESDLFVDIDPLADGEPSEDNVSEGQAGQEAIETFYRQLLGGPAGAARAG